MRNDDTAFGAKFAKKLPVLPKLLSFDVFGTLVDVRGGCRSAFESMLAEAGGTGRIDPLELWDHWEKANIQRYWEQPYRSYRDICRASLEEVFRKTGLKGDPNLIQLYFNAFASFKRFPDVDEVLDQLSNARYKLAVISNIDDDLLKATPLGRSFDVVCTAERAKGYKPDGTLFRYFLTASGLDVNEIFHSGQSQNTDLVGAKPIGFTVAWINRRGLARAEGVPEPDFEFRDLRPILKLLLDAGQRETSN
jgi:2-haloacid dehalogenase